MDGEFADRTAGQYDEIVVVGGGCYGAYYVRQLQRAEHAGALSAKRILVVDRDPACRVAVEFPDTEIVIREWREFFDEWLGAPIHAARDAIVPSPLMPHLFYEYIERRVRSAYPSRSIRRLAPAAPIGTPWERVSPDGVAYVSHATWTCPTNCVEPRICPHTRNVRDWTMPASLDAWAAAQREVGDSLLGPFTFHCTHRAYGVGMVDKQPIQRAERTIAEALQRGAVRALIATASHCHGAAAILAVDA